MPHWVHPSCSLDCSSLTWVPWLMASQSSSDSSVNYATHVSDTLCQSFDLGGGEAHLFNFFPINPDLWLCIRVSNGILDPDKWYYSRVNDKWFGLGLPITVWKDAIVLSSSVPDRLLVILDLIFGKSIPLRFYVRWVLMAPWLPSIREMVVLFLFSPFLILILLPSLASQDSIFFSYGVHPEGRPAGRMVDLSLLLSCFIYWHSLLFSFWSPLLLFTSLKISFWALCIPVTFHTWVFFIQSLFCNSP